MAVQTETIHIEGLPPGTYNALEELVRPSRKFAGEYLRIMIEAELLSQKSFDEVVEPIRRSFDENGLTEDELDALFKVAREEIYREKLNKNKSTAQSR